MKCVYRYRFLFQSSKPEGNTYAAAVVIIVIIHGGVLLFDQFLGTLNFIQGNTLC